MHQKYKTRCWPFRRGERGEEWLRVEREPTASVRSASRLLNIDSLSIQAVDSALKSWSSWVAIGRWRPAGSWRRLRGREPPSACASYSPFVNCPRSRKRGVRSPLSRARKSLLVRRIWGVLAYLVITYCWASFIFEINSARSEFNSFWAISIWKTGLETSLVYLEQQRLLGLSPVSET